MSKFKGFSDSENFSQVPDSFFHRQLKEIDDLAELKVTLYSLWRIEHTEGSFRALCQADFEPEAVGLRPEEIALGLEKAVQRGSLLRAEHETEVFYFLNSPRGCAAAESFRRGDWRASNHTRSVPPTERPNIFKLYEENVGPLTPLIADALRDAEETYPPEWLNEAIEIAVKNNKRNLRYVEAILKRWKEEGHAQKQGRRDTEKDRRKYIEGEYADYIEH
jgi:DNA replication protein